MRAIYRLYYLRLLYFTTKMTGSKTEAEDIVQEALMNFWINVRDRQIMPGNVQRYLFRMVRNRCINHLKRQQRIEENNGTATDEYTAQLELELDEVLGREALYQRILAGFAHLTPQQREVMECIYTEGLSVQEIAARMGTTENNVRNHKMRAIERLRQVLDPEVFLTFLLFSKNLWDQL
jgi:RNA polymerase sigma-70 factor, ECF subfamily